MIKPTMILISKDVLDTLSTDEIIYAEVSEAGAMGNSGGILFYTIRDEQLICYQTNIFTDEKTYLIAEKLLRKHENASMHDDLNKDEILFDYYSGGMGNSVFINKNVTLKTRDGYFMYNRNNKDYHIYSSVQGVFNTVVYAMKNS